MSNEKKKCSFNEHKEIDAIKFCQNCKIYLCKKCDIIHSGWFKNHIMFNMDGDLNDVFTGLCKEKNHLNELDYFCKTDNKLCCAKCITKLKDKENGQHLDCDVCFIKDIENEKKIKLGENMKYLESSSSSLEQSIDDLKKISEKINENKEELKTKIQKIFTNIRNILNEREDELMLEVDKKFNELFFNDKYIKKGEKLPKLIKKALETGKKINCQWDNNKLNFYINDCIDIENIISEIKKIEEFLKESTSKKNEIKLIADELEINNLLNSIKDLGKLGCNQLFDSNIDFDEQLIKTWLNNKNFTSELLFRKTKNGSTPEDFHNNCDNKGITITFIETTKGYKFGAYTESDWEIFRDKKKDNSTFLFSFNHKQKYSIKENRGSIGCNDSYDLWFGSECPEIHFNKTLDKGRSWDNPKKSTFLIKRILTNGEEYWDVKEMEVFKITYI